GAVCGARQQPGGRSVASAVFFFFSSRRRHTRCLSDWSSDVCSSDLLTAVVLPAPFGPRKPNTSPRGTVIVRPESATVELNRFERSEERRVGKEGRSRRPDEDRNNERNAGAAGLAAGHVPATSLTQSS